MGDGRWAMGDGRRQTRRMTTSGAILAGGRSSRLGGRPKGLEVVAGVRIIDRVADALRAVVPELFVISNDPEADHWLPDAQVGRDIKTGRSSLVGIHAAISRAHAPVIVVAWDMPFITSGLLALIRDRAE